MQNRRREETPSYICVYIFKVVLLLEAIARLFLLALSSFRWRFFFFLFDLLLISSLSSLGILYKYIYVCYTYVYIDRYTSSSISLTKRKVLLSFPKSILPSLLRRGPGSIEIACAGSRPRFMTHSWARVGRASINTHVFIVYVCECIWFKKYKKLN